MSLIYLRDDVEADEDAVTPGAPRPLDGWAWAGILFVGVILGPALIGLGLALAKALGSDAVIYASLLAGPVFAAALADRLLGDASTDDRRKGMATGALVTLLALPGWAFVCAVYVLVASPGSYGFA